MKSFVQYILLCAVTAATGAAVMSLPFLLIGEMSQSAMRLVLAGEVAAIAVVFSAVFLIKESREQKKKRIAASKDLRWQEMLRQISDTGSYGEDFDFAA